jgi:ribosomal protein S13
MMQAFTGETFGTVIYQEQVMLVAREIGKLSWEDVSTLRKAMSKSLGDEFFGKYWEQFCAGAIENGLDAKSARTIWDNICTFGSWAFNKSHAVSYGLISYWCAWLKAHHPLEFALGCLKNARSDDASLRLLREMVKEGIEYVPVDAALSEVDWSVKEGKLVGGLTNVKGIGPKKALEIVIRRKNGIQQTPAMMRLLDEAVTPFDDLFPAMTRFRDIYEHPEKHKIYSTHVSQIIEVMEDGYYVVIGKLVQRNLRDLNEAQSLNKRGGKRIDNNSQFFNLVIEDDSDTMLAQIDRWNFSRFRKLILEESGEGDWFLWGGSLKDGRRKLKVDKVRKL